MLLQSSGQSKKSEVFLDYTRKEPQISPTQNYNHYQWVIRLFLNKKGELIHIKYYYFPLICMVLNTVWPSHVDVASHQLCITKEQVQSHTSPHMISGGQGGTGIVFLLALQCPAISIIPTMLHTHISFVRHQHYIITAMPVL